MCSFLVRVYLVLVSSEQKEQEVTEKGEQRDAMQVLANGGVGAFFSVIYFFFPSTIFICAFVASIAAANSDTWASEIGSSSKQEPFHIVRWRRVAKGTSGAVTIRGTVAAIAGSCLIAICSSFLWGISLERLIVLLFLLTLAGFIGNLFDTMIGATSQVVYRCKVCGLETERKEHCEQKTVTISGVKWLNNDIVNVGCTIVGAFAGMVVGWLFL